MATLLPAERNHTSSLNGKWRFKVLVRPGEDQPAATGGWKAPYPLEVPQELANFTDLSFVEDTTWQDLDVPGNWEMAGHSPATYNQPDNACGLYRKWFEVPASWSGRLVRLNFDGVQNGAEVWFNGQPVQVAESSGSRNNYHEGGWTAWQVDLTPQVKFGQRNLLALRVAKNTKSADLDTGDYFFLGGIHRPVTLFTVPQTHLKDLTLRTILRDDGRAEVQVTVKVTGAVNGTKVSMALGERARPIAMSSDKLGQFFYAQVVSRPRLWSAEHPNLYPLTIELKDADGNVIEKVTRRVGIREVTIKNGVLLVNRVPVKLTGMCRHDVSAREGTAVGEKLWRKDLMLMREANVNAVRTSHYPYGAGFYDLCDELGFYVIDELPYCWCKTDDPETRPAFEQRARETIARDKNHPCVIIWGIGNENKSGRNLQVVADLVKQLDPTRPRLVSCKPADEYGTEFDDDHYTKPDNMRRAAEDRGRRARWPMIYTENPNVWDVRLAADPGCWDRWAAVLDRTWAEVWDADGIPGSFLWEWQDRAVADRCPTKLYEFDPATGINYFKVKGLVDAFRHPRPDYYHVKMVYAPIKVAAKLDARGAPTKIGLTISNYYSFTNLSELKTHWRLLSGGKLLKRGTARLKLAPRSKGKVQLVLPALPAAKQADTLKLDFDRTDGTSVASYQFALKPPVTATSLDAKLPEGLLFPRFNLVHNVTVNDPVHWRKITRSRGKLINVKAEPASDRDLAQRPLSEVRSLAADVAYEDDPTTVVAHVRAEYAKGEFKYRLEWSGQQADIQELGWAFEMPASYDRFSWQRKALWSVYPDTHIGRPTGTARPDSMDVHLTDITRPDAFDFNSTKYDCDWATLATARGTGLRVEFAASQRHHVRAGAAPAGGYQLVVNRQCSPPRDISSPDVPDYYLTLHPGDVVEGKFQVGSNRRGQP